MNNWSFDFVQWQGVTPLFGFDGKPPVYKPEEIQVASLGSLMGILSQTVVSYTSEPRLYYYHNDQLGTPKIMTDDTGTVVWEAEYKPFGEAEVHPSSTVVNNFRFPGQYYDQETGFHYNCHKRGTVSTFKLHKSVMKRKKGSARDIGQNG